MTSPADATPDQLRTFEQACATAVVRRVDFDGATLYNGRQVTKIALRGVYPDTDVRDARLAADLIWVNVAGM